MATLLLRLAGPLQAWGVQSLYDVRDSGREPSKSGVIGLLCAALGRPREADVGDLAALRFGVRVDREGRLSSDYQTWQAIGPKGKMTDCGVSRRYYLADAVFLAGLEGPAALLEQIQEALRRPRWALCLGRKAFVPSQPIRLEDGLRTGESLEEALRLYPWLGGREVPPQRLRVALEAAAGQPDPAGVVGVTLRADVPLSFAERRFASRRVLTLMYDNPGSKEEA